MESESSLSSVSKKARRGLRGLALMNSIGTLRCARGRSTCCASPPTSPIRLARPRPSRERASSAIASSLGFTRLTPELESVSDCRVGKAKRAHQNFTAREGGHGEDAFAHPTFPSMREELALALDHFGRKLEIGFAAD